MKMSPVSPFDSSNKNKSGMLARVLPYWIALSIWFNCQNSNNYINLISRRKLIWFSRFLTSLPSVTPVVTSQPIYSPNSQHSWTDYSLIVLRNGQLQTNKQKGTFQPPSPSNPVIISSCTQIGGLWFLRVHFLHFTPCLFLCLFNILALACNE